MRSNSIFRRPGAGRAFGLPCLWALVALLLAGVQSAVASENPDKYWLLEQYVAEHPQQRALMEEFSELVAGPPHNDGQRIERTVRIAVVYPGNQVSDYWRRSVQALEGRLRDLAITYRIESFFSRPGVETTLQEQQIVEALASDPDYLVFTLDANRHKRIIEHIIARGRPKLILQNITTPVREWGSRQPFFYVGFDHVQGTELLADELLGGSAPPKSAAILYWAPGYVSSMRGDTFLQRLQQADVRVSARYYTRSDQESARVAALAALRQDPALEFIFSCATDVTFGILDAIESDSRQQQVSTNGWGGGSRELQAIEAGRLRLTVMRINDDNGVAMAEAIRLDQQGLPVPQVYAGRLKLVTQAIPKAELEALKRMAFRYSGLTDQ